MEYQKKLTLFLLSFTAFCATQISAMELVKTCQEFKNTFLQACQIMDKDACTEKIKFVQQHLNFGGSILYFEMITGAIDDCIDALSKISQTAVTKEKINDSIVILKTFKEQITSDESYDLNTGVVYKRETLRSGKTRLTKLPYNANHCYKVYVE